LRDSSPELTNNLRLTQCLQLPSDRPNDRSCVCLQTYVNVSSFIPHVLNRQVAAYKFRIAHKCTRGRMQRVPPLHTFSRAMAEVLDDELPNLGP
jgi:hypothetical protein